MEADNNNSPVSDILRHSWLEENWGQKSLANFPEFVPEEENKQCENIIDVTNYIWNIRIT
jgi:hypothetical protein